MKTAIVGGGAAGFFLAINLKEMCPSMDITIFEKSQRVLRKVELSGGGRCNCTNSFAETISLQQVYPRGHRLLKRLFMTFNHLDTYKWFEQHGVELVTQPDQCVFPKAQDSHVIINSFLQEAHKSGIHIKTLYPIDSLDSLSEFDFIAITTGGSPRRSSLQWLEKEGHCIEEPVPSLFTFKILEQSIHTLMGTVAEQASLHVVGTKYKSSGPLLITHWGFSGPAALKLSSHAARWLNQNKYNAQVSINWLSMPFDQVIEDINIALCKNPDKLIIKYSSLNLPTRLWAHLVGKAVNNPNTKRWRELGRKELNRLANQLTNDIYTISGKASNKAEFVTCGGIALNQVNSQTLESIHRQNLYFAGEILDIDGVTGGFNLQAAWTTAYIVAKAINQKCNM